MTTVTPQLTKSEWGTQPIANTCSIVSQGGKHRHKASHRSRRNADRYASLRCCKVRRVPDAYPPSLRVHSTAGISTPSQSIQS